MYIKLTLANSFNHPMLITSELQLQSTPWTNKAKYSRMIVVKFVERQPLKDLKHYVLFKTEHIKSNTLQPVFHNFFICSMLEYFFPNHDTRLKSKTKTKNKKNLYILDYRNIVQKLPTKPCS